MQVWKCISRQLSGSWAPLWSSSVARAATVKCQLCGASFPWPRGPAVHGADAWRGKPSLLYREMGG